MENMGEKYRTDSREKEGKESKARETFANLVCSSVKKSVGKLHGQERFLMA